MKARQARGPSRLCSVAPILRLAARALELGGNDRVSLNTSTSPARSSRGRSLTVRSASSPPSTSSSRAANRAAARAPARSVGRQIEVEQVDAHRPVGAARSAAAPGTAAAAGGAHRQQSADRGADDRLGAAAARRARSRRRSPCPRPPGRRPYIAGPSEARHEHDEELAVGAVQSCARPCRRAAHVGQAVELGLEVGQRRAALAGVLGIAALRHEALDHPEEGEAVVEALAGQRLDPLDMVRRDVGRSWITTRPPVDRSRFQVFRRVSGGDGRRRRERRRSASAAATGAGRPRQREATATDATRL